MEARPSQATMLPQQLRLLATLATATGGAVGVSQIGSVLFVDTGFSQFAINARAEILDSKEENAQKDHYVRELRGRTGL